MAHKYHYRRHLIEARRNRLRLAIAVGLIVLATAIYTVPSIISHAATSATADLDGAKISTLVGGTYGGTTSSAFSTAIVTVTRVSTGEPINSTSNPFAFSGLNAIAAGDHYLVSVPPTAVGGYSVKGLTWCQDACTGFDPQSTNFQIGSAIDLTFYPNHFYHIRFIYGPVVAVAPAASPVPPAPAGAANPSGPGAPGSFQALVAGDNALVALSWTPPPATVGTRLYRLERSIDEINWTVVANGITALAFRDDTVTFGVHYYYRLSAKDLVGNVSGLAYAEATTAGFSANSANSTDGTFISDDQIARVDVPAGALDDSADCSVSASTQKISTSNQSLVAGPYSLVCKSSSGVVAGDFNKPVTWHFDLSTKLGGFVSPAAVLISDTGLTSVIDGAKYDSSNRILQFNQISATTTAVLASAQQGFDPGILVTLAVVLVLVAGVLVFILRKAQRTKYQEYMRKKYYDV